MTGNQPHKHRFATSAVPLFSVRASAEMQADLAARLAQIELAA
jgi:hypothetical protein